MAITSAGDIKGIMNAAGAIAATIAGVQKLYEKVGEIPPDDVNLPAILQSVTGADLPPARIVTLNNHEEFHHYWYMDLLVERAGDIYAEQDTALPFIPLVTAKFRANFNLGNRLIVDRCFPESYRVVVITAGANQFLGIRFLMHARTNWAVEYTDPS